VDADITGKFYHNCAKVFITWQKYRENPNFNGLVPKSHLDAPNFIFLGATHRLCGAGKNLEKVKLSKTQELLTASG